MKCVWDDVTRVAKICGEKLFSIRNSLDVLKKG